MRGRLACRSVSACSWETPPRMRGRPSRSSSGVVLDWKHPRVCGEDCVMSALLSAETETPPRMRGRHFKAYARGHRSGNTPAYAGKTFGFAGAPELQKKHPRVCGEDSINSGFHRIFRETPPRMRGRRRFVKEKCFRKGNTPAYAGKTYEIWDELQKSEKHPRVCGEDSMPYQSMKICSETPPRMRGRLYALYQLVMRNRNTPAYAGKTRHCWCRTSASGKHPRVCGEDDDN